MADAPQTLRHASPAGADGDAAAASSPAQGTARERQRQRMELKRALRVTVANLKSRRNKLTKMAGSKGDRRKVSVQMQSLLQMQLAAGSGAAAPAAGMTE